MISSALLLAALTTSPAPEPCTLGGPGPADGPLQGLVQPLEAPGELLALVEIPAGSAVKYELHEPSGRMEADRFLSMPMVYPANYGIFPCTLAEDGDALDVLVLTRFPLLPGSVIRVRPIGLLPMLDRGEQDDKVLAVPVNDVDPTYAEVHDVTDLPAMELARIEAFFRVYKDLPDGAEVELGAWRGASDARVAICAALGAQAPEEGCTPQR